MENDQQIGSRYGVIPEYYVWCKKKDEHIFKRIEQISPFLRIKSYLYFDEILNVSENNPIIYLCSYKNRDDEKQLQDQQLYEKLAKNHLKNNLIFKIRVKNKEIKKGFYIDNLEEKTKLQIAETFNLELSLEENSTTVLTIKNIQQQQDARKIIEKIHTHLQKIMNNFDFIFKEIYKKQYYKLKQVQNKLVNQQRICDEIKTISDQKLREKQEQNEEIINRKNQQIKSLNEQLSDHSKQVVDMKQKNNQQNQLINQILNQKQQKLQEITKEKQQLRESIERLEINNNKIIKQKQQLCEQFRLNLIQIKKQYADYKLNEQKLLQDQKQLREQKILDLNKSLTQVTQDFANFKYKFFLKINQKSDYDKNKRNNSIQLCESQSDLNQIFMSNDQFNNFSKLTKQLQKQKQIRIQRQKIISEIQIKFSSLKQLDHNNQNNRQQQNKINSISQKGYKQSSQWIILAEKKTLSLPYLINELKTSIKLHKQIFYYTKDKIEVQMLKRNKKILWITSSEKSDKPLNQMSHIKGDFHFDNQQIKPSLIFIHLKIICKVDDNKHSDFGLPIKQTFQLKLHKNKSYDQQNKDKVKDLFKKSQIQKLIEVINKY